MSKKEKMLQRCKCVVCGEIMERRQDEERKCWKCKQDESDDSDFNSWFEMSRD